MRCGPAGNAPRRWGLAGNHPCGGCVGGVCLVAIASGCRSGPYAAASPEWAAAAEGYAAALNDAYRVGITDAMAFYAADAHVDKRFINYEGVGRAGFAQALRDKRLGVAFLARDRNPGYPRRLMYGLIGAWVGAGWVRARLGVPLGDDLGILALFAVLFALGLAAGMAVNGQLRRPPHR